MPLYCCADSKAPVVISSTVDVRFLVQGQPLDLIAPEALYRALCRAPRCGDWFAATDVLAIAAVQVDAAEGRSGAGEGARSLLLRLPAEDLPCVLGLAGGVLYVDGLEVRFAPQALVEAIKPCAVLHSPWVTLATAQNGPDWLGPRRSARGVGGDTLAGFAAALSDELDALEVEALVSLEPAPAQPPLQERPCCAVTLSGLSPDDSVHLQEAGLGELRKLGCGIFRPHRQR
ncbi:type I-MYXAN CRISPR-associated protein Cas6/Cmx6 [Thiohalocapsa sp. ML1]|uniref:type I-MYXAN CRISPR-associated protein Cas6/Cmx6 n=1 Tax=Thiohalocapsa sp. ML1 TaxID=1431688 RepID=UPI0007322843|nr:type I-MYXAN CRISPR-associated protein Cas6/Cmx6 [Thiohalocapsa sp. ML1]